MKELVVALNLALILATVAGISAGCGGGLPSEDAANLQDAVRLTRAAYLHQDAGTAGAALIRQAHCSVQAVIRDQKLAAFDSGIPCN